MQNTTRTNDQHDREAYLARIAERATTLLQDGYRIERAHGNSYHVSSPVLRNTYRVDLQPAYSCTCPCFKHVGVCKHLVAVALMVADQNEAAVKAASSLRDAEAEEEFAIWHSGIGGPEPGDLEDALAAAYNDRYDAGHFDEPNLRDAEIETATAQA